MTTDNQQPASNLETAVREATKFIEHRIAALQPEDRKPFIQRLQALLAEHLAK